MPRQYAVGQRRLERKRTSRKKVMSILKNMIRTYSKVRRGTNGLIVSRIRVKLVEETKSSLSELLTMKIPITMNPCE
jgi:hypothetical protein